MTLLAIPPTIPLPSAQSPPTPRDARRIPAGAERLDPSIPSFAACREITRLRARNFYLGMRLAPEPQRSALLAIYAWMRHADDLADAAGPGDNARSRTQELEKFRDQTVASLDARSGGGVHSPGQPPWEARWWPAFVDTLAAYPIPSWVFTETLNALGTDARADEHPLELSTSLDLARYCDRVAGTVAIACLTIWGVRRPEFGPRAHHLAVLRARAVQLTNILRDLREDLDPHLWRSYLPADSYERHALGPRGLLAWVPGDRCAAMLGEWIDQARALDHASRDLESLIEPSCARVSWALSAVYRSLLEAIARDPARVTQHRVRVAPARKLSIALAGWLGVGLPG